jgi:TM2 domain-containing membrane protein YozV
MSPPQPPPHPDSPPRSYDLLAGVLSYLVPGLGQIYQGRVGKGFLFLVCIYTLFFYGLLYLGSGSVQAGQRTYRLTGNVYLPDTTHPSEGTGTNSLGNLINNLYNRPQFLGQFWVGVAAWPAIIQYLHFNKAEVTELDRKIDDFYRSADNAAQEKDRANAGTDEPGGSPAYYRQQAEELERKRRHPILGSFQQEPSAADINMVHNAGDKRLELGWVYTVIAGVLNIMVIYDAIAGPAFLLGSRASGKAVS